MSHRATLYVKDLRLCPNGETISQLEKLVAYALADYHQDKLNARTFPSVASLAAESMMDERACRRHLANLERKGVIERVRPETQGRGSLTFYLFCELDRIEKGGQCVPLLLNRKEGKRGTEGGQKEGCGGSALDKREQEQKQKLPTPPTPSPSEGVPCEERSFAIADGDTRRAGMVFTAAHAALKAHLLNDRPRGQRRDLAGGFSEWQKYAFSDLAVSGFSRDGPGRAVLELDSLDAAATELGLAKYGKTWARIVARWYGEGVTTRVVRRRKGTRA
jgi:hypothetical protein